MQKGKENSDPLMSYTATEVSTGKLIAKGNDFDEVSQAGEESGLIFMINFVPNPNVTFVF